jgi:hypothetical protein
LNHEKLAENLETTILNKSEGLSETDFDDRADDDEYSKIKKDVGYISSDDDLDRCIPEQDNEDEDDADFDANDRILSDSIGMTNG